MYSQKIQDAINISTNLHRSHIRIGLDIPYIVHPYSVALILTQYTKDEDVICAGLLHDVIEDVQEYNYDQMTNDFGERVTTIVRELTENKKPTDTEEMLRQSWMRRKKDRLDTVSAMSEEALLVCAADMLQNLKSLQETYQKIGDNLWNCFSSSREEKFDYYGRLALLLSARMASPLSKELLDVYKETAEFCKVGDVLSYQPKNCQLD